MNPHHEGKLLTGDRVHHCLEDARETRWPHASKAPGELAEAFIALGQPVEAADVDPEPEHALQDHAGLGDVGHAERGATAPQLHGEELRLRAALLADGGLSGGPHTIRVRR